MNQMEKEFKFINAKNLSVSKQEVISDLKRVAEKMKTENITQKIYSERGKFEQTVIFFNFDL